MSGAGRAHGVRIAARISPAPRSSSSAASAVPSASGSSAATCARVAHRARAVERAHVGAQRQRAGAALAARPRSAAWAAIGTWQPPSSVPSRARSAAPRGPSARGPGGRQRAHARVVRPRLDRQRALTDGRQHLVEVEREGDERRSAPGARARRRPARSRRSPRRRACAGASPRCRGCRPVAGRAAARGAASGAAGSSCPRARRAAGRRVPNGPRAGALAAARGSATNTSCTSSRSREGDDREARRARPSACPWPSARPRRCGRRAVPSRAPW